MIVRQIVIIASRALLIGPALRASHVLLLCNDSKGTSVTTSVSCSKCPFSKLAPLEAILFDIDGTLCDSDPIHYYAFREMLQEVWLLDEYYFGGNRRAFCSDNKSNLVQIGFNNGVPITEEFFVEKISGKFNEDIGRALFPDGDHERAAKFMDDKEAMFRR